MGNYLTQIQDNRPFHIMARHPAKSFGHEWIESNEVVLDITLDQFAATLPKAYAGKLLDFHRELLVNRREPVIDIEQYACAFPNGTRQSIMAIYGTIVASVTG
jgi:hypothetical protein